MDLFIYIKSFFSLNFTSAWKWKFNLDSREEGNVHRERRSREREKEKNSMEKTKYFIVKSLTIDLISQIHSNDGKRLDFLIQRILFLNGEL